MYVQSYTQPIEIDGMTLPSLAEIAAEGYGAVRETAHAGGYTDGYIAREGYCTVTTPTVSRFLAEMGLPAVNANFDTGSWLHWHTRLNHEAVDPLVVDLTWKQFLRKKEVVDEVPDVYVGHASDLMRILAKHGKPGKAAICGANVRIYQPNGLAMTQAVLERQSDRWFRDRLAAILPKL